MEKGKDILSGVKEYYHYGKVYLESGEPDNAIAQFETVLETEPKNANALIGMGRAHMQKKSYAQAVEYLDKALKISPDFADAHYYLGVVHLGQGVKEKAINEFKEALNLNPKYVLAKKKLNEIIGAGEAGAARNGDEREMVVEEEERISRQANVHFHMGNALFEKNMLKEAYEEYREAIRLRPNFPDIRNRLGELYVKRGKFGAAEEEFQKSLEINPKYLKAQINLAETRRLHGEMLVKKAEGDYLRVMEMDPENRIAQQGLEKIRAIINVDYI